MPFGVDTSPPFAARRVLRNAHVQTLGAALPIFTGSSVEPEAMRVDLPSGGALRAKALWHAGGDRTAVVILHGVGGSAESNYMRRAAIALHRAGFHAVRVNLQGAGDSVADATHLYHAGLIEDPIAAIDEVAQREGVRDVALLGFSLGGNVALKLAAAWRGSPPRHVRAVAAISAPLDLVETSRALERWRTLPYRRYVVRGLVAQGRAFANEHPHRARYDVAKLARITTIRAYDELVIAPMHDFSDAHDYYVRASSGPGLADVEIPTLLVHAEDDPMVPASTVRPWLRDASRAVRAEWTDRGGHVGWFSSMAEEAWQDTWAMRRVIEFFRAEKA
jgi:predicted alpha/beta-fold hydrolase